jgi:hypothetical protein
MGGIIVSGAYLEVFGGLEGELRTYNSNPPCIRPGSRRATIGYADDSEDEGEEDEDAGDDVEAEFGAGDVLGADV